MNLVNRWFRLQASWDGEHVTDQTHEPSCPTRDLQRPFPRREQRGGGPHQCPCCYQWTLEDVATYEICGECGWEDDGQDDPDADVVRGGPNGRLSLTQARAEYAAFAAGPLDTNSVVHGGEGSWWAVAKRHLVQTGEISADEASQLDTNG